MEMSFGVTAEGLLVAVGPEGVGGLLRVGRGVGWRGEGTLGHMEGDPGEPTGPLEPRGT